MTLEIPNRTNYTRPRYRYSVWTMALYRSPIVYSISKCSSRSANAFNNVFCHSKSCALNRIWGLWICAVEEITQGGLRPQYVVTFIY